MIMELRVADNLRFCRCGHWTVFLDLEVDRYYCITASTASIFWRLLAGEHLSHDDLEVLEPLRAKGLLVESAETAHDYKAPKLLPLGRDIPCADAKASTMLVLRALFAQIRSSFRIKVRGTRVLNNIGHVDSAKPSLVSLANIAVAFSTVDLLFHRSDRCFPRSVALYSVCRSFGLKVRLVIGVRTDPFTAHCWVQSDDSVVSGDFEEARLFTPIMVLP
jgi:hypothetical protein